MAFDFLAGCLGGCAGVLVGHPFDTIKVHLQTQDVKNPMYKGTYDCLKKIVERDSIKGLYKGVTSPMGGVAFVNAIVFGVYGNVNRHTNDPNSIQSHFFAGSIAGLVQSIICSPMELAKTRLQLQTNVKRGIRHKGPIQCLNYIRKTEGFRGIFRGLGITALRDVPGFSSYFVSYELLTRCTSSPNASQILLAGGLAGTISWILTFPIDVIKSRIQAGGVNGKPNYCGIRDCINQSYKAEGLSFITRGLVSTVMRAFPMNAACFFVVSLIMKLSNRSNSVKFDAIYETTDAEKSNLFIINSHDESTTSTSNLSKCKYLIESVLSNISLSSSSPSSSPALCSIGTYENHENKEELCRRKLHIIKSVIFSGALNEAIISSELIELMSDLYEDHDFYNNTTMATGILKFK